MTWNKFASCLTIPLLTQDFTTPAANHHRMLCIDWVEFIIFLAHYQLYVMLLRTCGWPVCGSSMCLLAGKSICVHAKQSTVHISKFFIYKNKISIPSTEINVQFNRS